MRNVAQNVYLEYLDCQYFLCPVQRNAVGIKIPKYLGRNLEKSIVASSRELHLAILSLRLYKSMRKTAKGVTFLKESLTRI